MEDLGGRNRQGMRGADAGAGQGMRGAGAGGTGQGTRGATAPAVVQCRE